MKIKKYEKVNKKRKSFNFFLHIFFKQKTKKYYTEKQLKTMKIFPKNLPKKLKRFCQSIKIIFP